MQYERWKDIVSGGNIGNLEHMTFLEFMAKLDREIERMEREVEQAKKMMSKHGK